MMQYVAGIQMSDYPAPSLLLETNVPLHELSRHLEGVMTTVRGSGAFVYGFADQAMPSSSWEHIHLCAEWAREHRSSARVQNQ